MNCLMMMQLIRLYSCIMYLCLYGPAVVEDSQIQNYFSFSKISSLLSYTKRAVLHPESANKCSLYHEPNIQFSVLIRSCYWVALLGGFRMPFLHCTHEQKVGAGISPYSAISTNMCARIIHWPQSGMSHSPDKTGKMKGVVLTVALSTLQ